MATLTLELPTELYRRIRQEADRLRKAPELVAQEWLAERLQPVPEALGNDREQVRRVLRAAGLLTELGPTLDKLADDSISLADVQASLAAAGGKSLSDIILEQRGPKE